MARENERADAARNRAAVLAAADRLFAESPHGTAVSMDEIAEAAGVGKGTLFRRFGDRAGLVRAVFEARTAWFREALESGPEPLGPDTPPRERVFGIMEALVRIKLDNTHLAQTLEEAPAGRGAELFASASYRLVHGLLADAVARACAGQTPPAPDAAWTAHVLLGAVRADLVGHLVATEGLTRGRALRDVRDLVERLLGP
ncbi:TetR/AcrR family transcriptional regulator [Nocardiopsis sp. CC223A]|uniref:TetR/AcrR family transcriptional regulator n=1 Tax=Nocardiopsis sp. CC223A TaxID=3044051 RepID=UPI00278C3BA2|nr:TetR/AcrR family transcriptional regulator [Nocardiopsis sp. CC223A]